MTKLERTALLYGIGASFILMFFCFFAFESPREIEVKPNVKINSKITNVLKRSSSDKIRRHSEKELFTIYGKNETKAVPTATLFHQINEAYSTEAMLEETQRQLNQREVLILVLILLLLSVAGLALFAFRLSKKRKDIADSITMINADKDHFIGVVSHDLRSPLNSIMALSSIMAESPEKTSVDEIQEFSSIILSSSHRMEHLINNMLDANKIDTGNTNLSISPVSLTNATTEILDSIIYLAREKEIETEIFLEENLPNILADYNAVQRVLENLISNAYKFSPEKGVVKISATLQGNQVQVSIKDYGLGMSELDRSKLFKKFEKLSASPTGNEKSTGLGLFIVKNLMTKMNGTILVESELGKGTTFSVLFNVA